MSTVHGQEVMAGLALMRKEFESHQISKMCKATRKDNQPGRCKDCGGFHKLPSVQLSYVGHAAITDRLLAADPLWTWEPLALAPNGSPLLDADGGMWIRLTVCGVTRIGYGDAQGKQGGDAMKERIGDALRNAAMRFGAALDLWHKGDLHAEAEESPAPTQDASVPAKPFGDVPRRATASDRGGGAGLAIAAPLTPEPAKPKQTDFPHGHSEPQTQIPASGGVAVQPEAIGTVEPLSVIPGWFKGQPDAKLDIPTPNPPPVSQPGNTSVKKDAVINQAQLSRLVIIQKECGVSDTDLAAFLRTVKTEERPDGLTSRRQIPKAIYDIVTAWCEGKRK